MDSQEVLEHLLSQFYAATKSVLPSPLPLVYLGTIQDEAGEKPLLAGYFQLDWLPYAATGQPFLVEMDGEKLELEPFAYVAHEHNPYVGVALYRLRNPEALQGLNLSPAKPPSSLPAFAISPYLGLAEFVTDAGKGFIGGLQWAQHGWCGSPVFDALGGLYGFVFGVPAQGKSSVLPAQALRLALLSLEQEGLRISSPLK